MTALARAPAGCDHGRCRVCGARILWARRSTDRAQPIDIDPVTDGPVVMENSLLVQFQALLHNDGRPRYTPHRATCASVFAGGTK